MKRTPLARTARLVRRTPLAQVSTKRKPARDGWWQVRRWCLDRAEGRCEICGDRAHHAHHILPRSAGGKDDLANLLAVCWACHRRAHDNPQWAREPGYLRSRYGGKVA